MATSEDPFGQVRTHCLALEGVTERLSHGSPSFFSAKRCFVMCMDDHHGDGVLGLWVAAPPGAQEAAVADDPETFFRPPYVGHRGWLGVRLDRALRTAELHELLDEAHAAVQRKV